MTPQEQMTISAIRYALGRSSYIVGETVEWVMSLKERCENFNRVATRDIEDYLKVYPGTMYSKEWRDLIKYLQ